MVGKITIYAAVVAISLCAGALVAAFQLQEQRSRAQVEVKAAHAELELALSTLAVRMANMASALERASDASPVDYTRIYADAARGAVRVQERAIALMFELEDPDEARGLVAQFSNQFDSLGYPSFEVFPPEQTDAFFPALFVEPQASRSNVFGYNMGSSPERLSAARDALDRGVMTVSRPVVLSQDADLSQVSFLVLYPVYLPETETSEGPRRALLGAGMTPMALYTEHVVLFDNHVIEIEIGISDVALPITLGGTETARSVRLPILRTLELPSISSNGQGFEMTFRASVFYLPTARSAVLPLLAFGVTALILSLIARGQFAREAARQELAIALERNETKLRNAYRVQARSQRIEALGRLVGGVAHDFNNILSVILGNLELLKEEGRTDKDEPLVEEAIAATYRGAHLTRKLLSVGRKSHLQPQVISVSEALHDSVRMLQRVLPESIEISVVPAAGLWPIEVDPDGLQNAILNLALNARDATQARGRLTIEASNTRASQDYLDARNEEELSPGRYVMISVTDDGPGMAPAVADRAFEPFFTTKSAADGSGLGLPSVLGFCRQSGGGCRIYSEPDIGTSVKMYFPAVDQVDTQEPEANPVVPSAVQGSRILLAEDEDGVARVILQQLEAVGYVVTRVSSGDAAWKLLQKGVEFDLLISDLVMPGVIQGAELARLVEAQRPDMGLLLISGYPQEAAIEGNGVATRHPVLTKPVPQQDLLNMVGRLLQKT